MKLRHECRMFEELQERLEFSERLLAEGRYTKLEESETPTPV